MQLEHGSDQIRLPHTREGHGEVRQSEDITPPV